MPVSKGDEQLRVIVLNVNGMTGESKRRELVEKLKSYNLDTLEIGETHTLGHDVCCENGNDECGLCEGMEGEVAWTEMNENYQKIGKERCAR